MIYLFDVVFLEMGSGPAPSAFQVGHDDNFRSTVWRKRTDLAKGDNILLQQNYEGIYEMPSFSCHCSIYKTFLTHSKTKEHANLSARKPETTASDPSKFLPWHLCGDGSSSHGTVCPGSETTCDAAQTTSSGLLT